MIRGVFADEADARLVAAALERDGWRADCRREAFSGEDDDQDHAWAVLTDAPDVALDLWCERLDGWLDTDPATRPRPRPGPGPESGPESGPDAQPVPPLDLPTQPRRRRP